MPISARPISAAGIAAIRDGRTRYTPTAGIPELREAVAGKLKRDQGLDYAPDEIIVGCGAKQVLFNAFLATLDPGDEVIVPAPCWVSYPERVRLAGGEPVVVACPEAEGFKLTPQRLAAAITPRSKWLLLNTPANPTGAVYTARELAALGEVLRARPGLWLLSDEIYEHLVYEPAGFASPAAVLPDLGPRTLLVNGVSKAYAMTGWRVGYGAGPRPLIAAMTPIQGQTTSHTSSIAQHAAVAALDGGAALTEDFRRTFRARRDLVVERLSGVPGLRCRRPDGAFYLFPDCRGLFGRLRPDGQPIRSDLDVAQYLLEQFGVALVPGSSFLAEGHLRLSYAAASEALERACNRIRAACETLVRAVA